MHVRSIFNGTSKYHRLVNPETDKTYATTSPGSSVARFKYEIRSKTNASSNKLVARTRVSHVANHQQWKQSYFEPFINTYSVWTVTTMARSRIKSQRNTKKFNGTMQKQETRVEMDRRHMQTPCTFYYRARDSRTGPFHFQATTDWWRHLTIESQTS